ncbi:hypothetical protein F1880_001921 [Penicillium rolfsii]|nr:hypothetical protein F1880_001921 [Penicillium rolfsii]
MPKAIPVPVPLRSALIECFQATTRLVRPELRRQLILIGGAASIAHGSVYSTEDVDVAAPKDVIIDIFKKVMDGALNFLLQPDGNIQFDCSKEFIIQLEILQIGGAIERIHAAVPFFEGSVASMSDLLRMRAETVVDRGSDGDLLDFKWLLSEVAKRGEILPKLNENELVLCREAGVMCLGRLDRLVFFSVLREEDARRL